MLYLYTPLNRRPIIHQCLTMQEPKKDPNCQEPGKDRVSSSGKAEWQTPEVTEISRFDILSFGPTPGSEENATYSDKSG